MLKVTLEPCTSSGDYYTILRIWHNSICVLEESDFGEPEDNTFGRDYKWIKPAIEKAYALGRQDILEELRHKEK